jgi:CheY-like chemotaxis protein
MAGEKILVVDDDKIIQALFQGELGPKGYEVDAALCGEEALEKVKQKKYDLVFMDFVLPGMDGIKTCQAVKKIAPDSEIVFMTGWVSDGMTYKEVKFMEAGGKVYYLYKPFIEGEIIATVNKALAEKNAGK